jgi:hypothetical protein
MITKKRAGLMGLFAAGTSIVLATAVMATGYGASAPAAPAGISVSKLSANSVKVTWTAPASNGGSAVTGYSVTSNVSTAKCTTTGALTCNVSSLKAGTYTFSVKATNAVGTGAAKAASAVSLKAGSLLVGSTVSFSKYGSKSSSTSGYLANVPGASTAELKSVTLTTLKKAPVLSTKSFKRTGTRVSVAFYNSANGVATLELVQGSKVIKLGKAKSFSDYKSATTVGLLIKPSTLKVGNASLVVKISGKKKYTVAVKIVK